MPTDINDCYDAATYPIVVSCNAGHNLETVEWSGTAMLEGIANWQDSTQHRRVVHFEFAGPQAPAPGLAWADPYAG